MKVAYPLSLKISLWLLLNLVLLGAIGVGFFVVQGGLGWSALLAGPTGDRAQANVNFIAGQVAEASTANRAAVLERFGVAYDAEFSLFRLDDGQILGASTELPEMVRGRLETLRQTGRGPFGADFGPPDRERFGEGRRPDGSIDETRRFQRGKSMTRREPTPEGETPERTGELPTRREMSPGFRGPGIDLAQEIAKSRFVIRAGSPTHYWVGLRTFFSVPERGRPAPAMLIARVDSFWALLRFLDLQSWLLAGTGVLALSVFFWWPLIRGITNAVGQLTKATEQIADGHFEARVPTDRRDELGRLGESVNRMATRLDAHMNGQKRFLGDVAHELCSPLARLQVATGILAERAPLELHETVTDVREEVQQMSTLVNELLAFTKAGLQRREVTLSVFALAPLVQEVLGREGADGAVVANIPADLSILAERDSFARGLANLVRNAVRYAGEAGPITVSGVRTGDRVIVSVEDEGPGVPAAALDRLGEPFFRPEAARTRELGGVGLGLSIVRSSLAACGGEVRFTNRTPRGFRAELIVKAAK